MRLGEDSGYWPEDTFSKALPEGLGNQALEVYHTTASNLSLSSLVNSFVTYIVFWAKLPVVFVLIRDNFHLANRSAGCCFKRINNL